MNPAPIDDANFFAPPTSAIGKDASAIDFLNDPADEVTRRKYLRHEVSVKSIGMLCYLIAGLFAFVTMALVFMLLGRAGRGNPILGANAPNPAILIAVGLVMYGGMAAVAFAVGFGLRRLQVWARFTMMVLDALVFLYIVVISLVLQLLPSNRMGPFPFIMLGALGLLLAYIFYLLVLPRSGVIFSAEYRLVIQRTPQIKIRTSLIVKILLGLLIGLILVGGIAAFFSQ